MHPFDPSYSHPDRCIICRQPRSHPNHALTLVAELHCHTTPRLYAA